MMHIFIQTNLTFFCSLCNLLLAIFSAWSKLALINPTHAHTIHYLRIFNAFNDSSAFKVMLTTGTGEKTACSQDEFESDELGFMEVSNRSAITIGQYV